nr:hypothetical protein [Klebsiella michiganensis]
MRSTFDISCCRLLKVTENTALSHLFLQITQPQGVSQIPANTLSDNIDRVM